MWWIFIEHTHTHRAGVSSLVALYGTGIIAALRGEPPECPLEVPLSAEAIPGEGPFEKLLKDGIQPDDKDLGHHSVTVSICSSKTTKIETRKSSLE